METHSILFRKEIANFIAASERLQSMLAQGDRLSSDEAGVVRFCAVELLEKIPEPFLVDHYS
ncbi:MAG: hypothetical protein QM706_16090 [Nitrospira sp.]